MNTTARSEPLDFQIRTMLYELFDLDLVRGLAHGHFAMVEASLSSIGLSVGRCRPLVAVKGSAALCDFIDITLKAGVGKGSYDSTAPDFELGLEVSTVIRRPDAERQLNAPVNVWTSVSASLTNVQTSTTIAIFKHQQPVQQLTLSVERLRTAILEQLTVLAEDLGRHRDDYQVRARELVDELAH